MNRRAFLSTLAAAAAPARERPNIVIVLADDLGYGDLACYNTRSRIPTPNLDGLAAGGVRFTDAHTPSAVCTPTRYGLLTGRYCWRTLLKKGVLDGFDPPLIEPGRQTLASLLKRQGYATACVGKWHLGMQWKRQDGGKVPLRESFSGGFRPGYDVDYTAPLTGGPNDVGFDWYFGISASLDMSPYCFIENRRTVGIPAERTRDDKTLTMNQAPGVKTADFRLEDVMPACTRKAVEYLAGRKNAKQPFFLYMPLTAPHLPVVPNREFEGRSKAGKYGDFVAEVDDAMGAVMRALDAGGLASDTLVFFTSDNGGLWHWWDFVEADDVADGRIMPRGAALKKFGHQSNGELRGTKADIWEGGHRVPFIARWPGRIRPGGVSEALVCLTDMMATCADITGAALPAGAGEDSVSMRAALFDARAPARRDVVLHSLHGAFAIREGEWKLVESRGSGGFSSPRTMEAKPGEARGQLYNLRLDPREMRNVYLQNPEVVERMTKLLARRRAGA